MLFSCSYKYIFYVTSVSISWFYFNVASSMFTFFIRCKPFHNSTLYRIKINYAFQDHAVEFTPDAWIQLLAFRISTALFKLAHGRYVYIYPTHTPDNDCLTFSRQQEGRIFVLPIKSISWSTGHRESLKPRTHKSENCTKNTAFEAIVQ